MNENQVGTDHRGLRGNATTQAGEARASLQRQVSIPIEFEGERFEEDFQAEMIVQGKVIVELWSVERVIAAHKKQLLTYLKATG